MKDRVLVAGSGGREHALAWKIAQSGHVDRVYIAPGNAGTALEEKCENVPIKAGDFKGIADFVKSRDIGLTVVGPEDPLAAGIVDFFYQEGLPQNGHSIFGPTAEAARLESSKVWAKEFMKKNRIPTAEFRAYDNHHSHNAIDRAEDLLEEDGGVVIKADGLAAGKGAIVCSSSTDIASAIDRIMKKKEFGSAGDRVVVERFMRGEEASILALTDGSSIRYLASSQDHKPVYDGDKGPNTGGMGAYSPAPIVTDAVMEKVKSRIAEPTIEGMSGAGSPFRGCLYMGLMIDRNGDPNVVEYNIRFGDPEAQPVLSVLDSDLFELLHACSNGNLGSYNVREKQGAACCVVMASSGYPGKYQKGLLLDGLEEASEMEGVKVFHAGTARDDKGRVKTSGGRVLGVTGYSGEGIAEAQNRAYKAVEEIDRMTPDVFHYRNDIADKAIGGSK